MCVNESRQAKVIYLQFYHQRAAQHGPMGINIHEFLCKNDLRNDWNSASGFQTFNLGLAMDCGGNDKLQCSPFD